MGDADNGSGAGADHANEADNRLLQSSISPYELSMLSQRQPRESSALGLASPANGGTVQEASIEAIFSDNEEAN